MLIYVIYLCNPHSQRSKRHGNFKHDLVSQNLWLPRNVPQLHAKPEEMCTTSQVTILLHQNRDINSNKSELSSLINTHIPALGKNEWFSPILLQDLWLAFYREEIINLLLKYTNDRTHCLH